MRNLLGRLHDRPADTLATMARFWDVDLRGRDPAEDVARLFRVLVDPWAFALVWERLSAAEQRILSLLATADAALTVEEVAEQVGDPIDTVREAMRQLYRAGLLYVEAESSEQPQVEPRRAFLPRELAHVVRRLEDERRRGMPTGETIPALLDRLDDGALVEMAEQMGVRVVPAVANRSDLVHAVQPRLLDPTYLRDATRSLDPGAARLWSWLVEHQGSGEPDVAQAALGYTAAELRRAIDALSRRGLLWRGYQDGRLCLCVPDRIRSPEPLLRPPAPRLQEVNAEAVDPVTWVFPFAAAWDLLVLLRAGADGRLERAGSSGNLDSSLGRRLAPGLWRRAGDLPPAGYLPFLRDLAISVGLIDARSGVIQPHLLRDWLHLSFPEQARRLVHHWRRMRDWPEGESRDVLQVWGADWPGFRTALQEQLRELQPGTWYVLDAVLDRFAARAPDALGRQFTAALSHEEPNLTPDERRREVLRQAAFVTLETAANWLGLVERSSSRGKEVLALGEAAWLLTDADPPAEAAVPGASPIVVQPSFDVLLVRPTPGRVWTLSAFTEPVALDRVSTYRLTRRSIERALTAGQPLARITGYLERQSGAPLPQAVAYELAEWVRAFRRVRLRQAIVIQPDEASDLTTLLETLRGVDLHVERIAADRLLVLVPGDGDESGVRTRIEQVLRSAGHNPLWLGD